MTTVRNTEIICQKFNIVGISTSGNYEQKWITKLYNYKLLFLLASPYRLGTFE